MSGSVITLAHSSSPHTPAESWTLTSFLLAVAASVLATLIVLLSVVKFFPDALPLPQIEEVKIRVVDMVGLSVKAAEKYPSEEASDAALQRVFKRLKALHEDGYIILASQQVISVPEQFVLSTEELLKSPASN